MAKQWIACKFDFDQSDGISSQVPSTPGPTESQDDQVFNLRLIASLFGKDFKWEENRKKRKNVICYVKKKMPGLYKRGPVS